MYKFPSEMLFCKEFTGWSQTWDQTAKEIKPVET